ncbi:MAG: (2Fe-2S)-binding protein [Nanohaloarchaea archaeon]|nr:(2Fe-2S)-binding protein [Candidatus Nanohaloarchaea archaeon]
MTHKIEVVDRGDEVEAEDGQDILNALLEGGVEWLHACGGFCNCTTCRVKVEEGMDNLSPRQKDEENTLKRFQGEEVLEGPFRLSCQAKVYGDVKISEPEWI